MFYLLSTAKAYFAMAKAYCSFCLSENRNIYILCKRGLHMNEASAEMSQAYSANSPMEIIAQYYVYD